MTVALAGCTAPPADPEPATTPSPTVEALEPTPTPEPTTPAPVAAPVRPPEMDRADEAGALAAAEYALRLYVHALNTGDLEEWNRISGQTCEFCDNTREDVERVYSTGGRYSGGALVELFDTKVVGFDEQLGFYGVQVGFDIAGGAEHDSTGSVVADFPPDRGHVVLEVVPSTRGWVLLAGDALQEPVP